MLSSLSAGLAVQTFHPLTSLASSAGIVMLPTASSLEGKHVPRVTFKTRLNDQWKDVTSDDIFKDKNVVVFALPGAFTPTCSSTHLPRYDELALAQHKAA